MRKAVVDLISDADVDRVHGYANFGEGMSKRQVVNEGVLKYAAGCTSGHTQLSILLEHGLLKNPRLGRYDTTLTAKGHAYLGAMLREAPFSKLVDVLHVK